MHGDLYTIPISVHDLYTIPIFGHGNLPRLSNITSGCRQDGRAPGKRKRADEGNAERPSDALQGNRITLPHRESKHELGDGFSAYRLESGGAVTLVSADAERLS